MGSGKFMIKELSSLSSEKGEREMEKRTLTRRDFLRLSTLTTAGVITAACAAPTPVVVEKEKVVTKEVEKEVPVEKVVKETVVVEKPVEKVVKETKVVEKEVVKEVPKVSPHQAPMLQEQVKAGKLPPLEDRLPVNPCVLPVMEKIGRYGGAMRRGFKGVADRWGPTKLNDHNGLVWFDSKLTTRARIAESWDINEDASEWIFHLRKGMKWSDGHPFDSDSMMWWYKYVLRNETLTPAPPYRWSTGMPRVMMEMEALDKYTVKVKFAHPNPLFTYKLCRAHPYTPGHYMKQFHIDTTEDKEALERAVKEAGFSSWDEYFTDRNWWYMNPERPSVWPWVAKNPLSEELFVMERNPYFFCVDEEGNQLPYIDTVTHRLFETTEVFNMWIVGGEIDFQARHVAIGNYTLFKENEDKGDYKVFLGVTANHTAVQPNHTCKDPRIREFFQDRRVRIALSLAVNREEMNELLYDGMCEPRQYSPLKRSPQYYPKQAYAYIEYDPDRANELLDEAGYTERDSEGFRLWKDGSGETLSFIIEGTAEPGSVGEDEALMICKYYADVGVKATYKYVDRSLYEEHWAANEIEMAFWGGDRTVLPIAAPWIFLGTMIDRPWACAWGLWKNNPDDPNGEKPPEGHWIWDIWGIWDQIEAEPSEAKRTKLFYKILDIWAEELPMIGYLGEKPAPIIVKNGFRNYLEGYPVDDTTGDEHLLNTETYFWEEPEKHT